MIGRVIGIEKLSHKKCVVSTDVRADVYGMSRHGVVRVLYE